jgi:hypothetical protein
MQMLALLALGATAGALRPPADWNGAFARYAADPFTNRAALLALRHRPTEDVAPLHLLALADAELRAGRLRGAERHFEEARARGLPEPWGTWAEVGVAWTALARGDVAAARTCFLNIAAEAPGSRAMAEYALALIDAGEGTREGGTTFITVAGDAESPTSLRTAARLGAAYARYWAGEYGAAELAFRALVAEEPDGVMADDARYAAAWSALQAGDRQGAMAELRQLAAERPTSARGSNASRELVNLEPRALVHAGFQRYRRLPLRAPEEQLAAVLNGDGVALARAALRSLADEPEVRAPLAGRLGAAPSQDTRVTAGVARAATAVSAASSPEVDAHHGGAAIAVVVLVLASALFAHLTRARSSGAPRRR